MDMMDFIFSSGQQRSREAEANSLRTEREADRLRSEATQTKALRTYMAEVDPQNKDRFTSMGLGELEGTAKGFVVKQHMDELAREQRLADELALQISVPGGVGPAAPLTPERALQAYSRSRAPVPPQVISRMIQDNEGVDWQNVMPRPFEMDGVKGAVGRSGQFQFLPQATPDSLTAVPVMDDQGNMLGMRVPTGKGGTAALPQPKGRKELPPTFFEKLADPEGLAAEMQRDLLRSQYSDEQVPATILDKNRYRKDAKAKHEAAKAELGNLFDAMEAEGAGKPETWEKLRKQYGLAAPAQATAVKTVTTQAQFDALPKGATYTGKDGKQYRKP
jgi:hypothetical protein